MKIPKKIKIFGLSYDIVMENDPRFERDTIGEIVSDRRVIHLSSSKEIHPDKLKHTLIHEIVHGILNDMQEGDLSNNEQFVNIMSLAFYEIINQLIALTDEDSH